MLANIKVTNYIMIKIMRSDARLVGFSLKLLDVFS